MKKIIKPIEEEKVRAITHVYAFDESFIPENPSMSAKDIYEKYNLAELGIEPRHNLPKREVKSIVSRIWYVIVDGLTHTPFEREEY